MNTRTLCCAALLAALVLTVPATVDAQLGGALKAARNKVRDQVAQTAGSAERSEDSGTPATPAAGSPSGASNAVVEITAEVLDRLERALGAEAAERAEVARALAALPTPEKYASCQAAVMQSPEVAAVYERHQAALAKHENDPQAQQNLLLELSESLNQLTAAHCGGDPSQQDALRREMASRPEAAGAKAGNFTIDNGRHFGTLMVSREYAILKERILPLCLKGGESADGSARVHGEGKGFYVYTAAEVQALKPRCRSLTPALQRGL